MRFFPRAPRRLCIALATAVVLTGIVSIPAAQADDEQELRDKQRDVLGQIESANADLEGSSAAARTAGAALATARSELVGARGRLGQVQEQLGRAEAAESLLAAELAQTTAALTRAQEELVVGTRATTRQRREVASTVSEIYQRGDPQLLAFSSLLQAQTPADVTRQLNFNDVVVGKQGLAYDDLAAAQVRLTAQEAAVEQARADVAARRDAAAETVRETADLRAQALDSEADLDAAVGSRREARRAAAAARRADLARLQELRKQEQRVEEQILAAKEAARLARVPELRVATSEGLLTAPVDGSITSPYGFRRHPIYGYWGLHDGTDFGVSCGEGLRAAGDGTVLSTYYSSVYGNRLFLDLGTVNGKAVTAVYNHAAGYRASVGDVVKRGDILGTVGSTGWSTGCHLHFSVLEDGTAVDPTAYL